MFKKILLKQKNYMWHFFSFSYDISTIYTFISYALSERNVNFKTQNSFIKI